MSAREFWIGIGDIHGETERVSAIADMESARGVIISGDLTIKGGAAEARRVLDAVAARNPVILAQSGNMDPPDVDSLLDARNSNIHCRGFELAPAGDDLPAVAVIGVGASTPTPFNTPNEVSEEQIAAWLEQAFEQVRGSDALLLVAHDPPHRSVADILPGGRHVGSRAVREFIDRVQPDVCLTGHIHESKGLGTLGKTTVVNPGPLAAGGYVLLERTEQGLAATLHQT